jgi:hypothetical protein
MLASAHLVRRCRKASAGASRWRGWSASRTPACGCSTNRSTRSMPTACERLNALLLQHLRRGGSRAADRPPGHARERCWRELDSMTAQSPMMSASPIALVFGRCRSATCGSRCGAAHEALLPIGFFVVAVALFPLGVGPEPQTLRQIAPGVSGSARCSRDAVGEPALRRDFADGSLEQMLLTAQSAWSRAARRPRTGR